MAPGILKYVFLISAVIFLIVIAFAPLLIKKGVNSTFFKDQLTTAVYDRTGIRPDVSKINFNLFPSFGIELQGFDFDSGHPVKMSVQSIKIVPDLSQLVSGTIAFRQIHFLDPVVSFDHFDAWLKKVIENSEPAAEKTGPEKKIPPGSFPAEKLIDSFENLFTHIPFENSSIEIQFTNLHLPFFKGMNGSVKIGRKADFKKIQVDLTDLNFSLSASGSTELGSFINQKISLGLASLRKLQITAGLDSNRQLEGQVDITGLLLKNEDQKKVAETRDLTLFFKVGIHDSRIEIKPFKLNYPDAEAEINFTSSSGSKLVFKAGKMKVGDARTAALLFFKGSETVAQLFDIVRDGYISHIDVSLTGKDFSQLFDEDNLSLHGTIENGVVKIPETDLFTSRVSGKASVKRGVLDIGITRGFLKNSEIKTGSLSVDLLNYIDIPFTGNFSIDTDLSEVPGVLIELDPDPDLVSELKKVHEVKGRALTELGLKLPAGSEDLQIHIKTDDFNISGRYNTLSPDKIFNSIDLENINFSYTQNHIQLKNIQGKFGENGSLGQVKNLDVSFDLEDKPLLTIETGTAAIELERTIPWLKTFERADQALKPVPGIRGHLNIQDIKFDGVLFDTRTWKYAIQGSGKNIAMSAGHGSEPVRNMNLGFKISENGFKLDSMGFKLNNLSFLNGKPDFKLLEQFSLPVTIKNAEVMNGKGVLNIKSAIEFATGPEFETYLSGTSLTDISLESIRCLDGDMTDAGLTIDGKSKNRFIDFKGIFNTDTLRKVFKPDASIIRQLNDITQNEPLIVKTGPENNIFITAKKINLDTLNTDSSGKDAKKYSLHNKTIHFKTDHFQKKWVRLSDVDSVIKLDSNLSYLKIKKASLCGLAAGGFINLKEDKAFMNLSFDAENGDLDYFLACLLDKNHLMDGKYRMRGNLSVDSEKKTAGRNIIGNAEFEAESGRIYKLTLLSRILSVINVSKIFKGKVPDITQDGFKYKTITAAADIKNSILELDNAVIDGEDMTLIFKGKIDPLNDRLDLICLVAPLKTIDMIIEKIPLVNTLLGGRLLTVPVKIGGSLSDPSVTPLHPSAVGKGLLDMMGNILKTPVKLLDKINE